MKRVRVKATGEYGWLKSLIHGIAWVKLDGSGELPFEEGEIEVVGWRSFS